MESPPQKQKRRRRRHHGGSVGVGGFSSVLLSRERIAVFVVMLCKRPWSFSVLDWNPPNRVGRWKMTAQKPTRDYRYCLVLCHYTTKPLKEAALLAWYCSDCSIQTRLFSSPWLSEQKYNRNVASSLVLNNIREVSFFFIFFFVECPFSLWIEINDYFCSYVVEYFVHSFFDELSGINFLCTLLQCTYNTCFWPQVLVHAVQRIALLSSLGETVLVSFA